MSYYDTVMKKKRLLVNLSCISTKFVHVKGKMSTAYGQTVL